MQMTLILSIDLMDILSLRMLYKLAVRMIH
jgi:hypothetical protein